MDIEQKMAALQDKIVAAVKTQNDSQLEELKAEISELRKEAGRFTAQSEQKSSFYGLHEACEKIATVAANAGLTKNKNATCRIEIGQNPYDLEKKTINYNAGNTTISQDMRQVLSATQRPGIVPFRLRPPAIRDLLNVVPTTSEFINYVRASTPTNNAAYVAEAALKPESAFAFTVERAMVETIAHTLTAPLQLVKDVNSLTAFLQNKLVEMLRVKSEDAYLYGNGVSPDIRGIMNFSGVGTTTQLATDNRIDTIRKALLGLEVSFYPWADALVIHPNDVAKIELLKDTQERYLWPTFGAWATGVNAPKSLFGVPLISTTAIAEGTFLAGNFGQGVTCYQREDVTVDFSFEHADYFAKNLVMIRAESRECLVPEDPKCFNIGTFLGGIYN